MYLGSVNMIVPMLVKTLADQDQMQKAVMANMR